MSRTIKKHLSGVRQPELFGFEAVEVIKASVNRFLRYTRSGKLNGEIDYGAWLAFHAGLNSRGLVIESRGYCTVYNPLG